MAHFNSKWTEETLRLEALKFDTKSEFQKNAKGAYLAAYRRGLLDTITTHMHVLRRAKWTIATAITEASRFKTLTEFHARSSSAYSFLKREGFDIHEIIAPVDTSIWNLDTILDEAFKYGSRNEFKQANSSAYHAAHKLQCIDSVCSHMSSPQRAHTYEEIRIEALKYTTKTAFKRGHYGMYQAACRQGIIDKVGSHMELDIHSFNPMKPAILYYFKIQNVWKIGITNYTLKDRYYKRDRDLMSAIRIWEFELGSDAYQHEQTILKLNKEYQYTGDTPFTDGTGSTECFMCDIYKL